MLFLSLSNQSAGQTYRISDGGTVYTCSGTFYDSGGPSANYGNNENFTITICSDNGGSIIADFTNFSTRNTDILHIYDGPTTGYPEIGTLSGFQPGGAGAVSGS